MADGDRSRTGRDGFATVVTFEVRGYDDPDVATMVSEVQAEYQGMYGGPDEATVDVDEFSAPHGVLVVAAVDGVPVATGGWRLLDGAEDAASGAGIGSVTAEIKRMYVRESARRHGIARAVLTELERRAELAGVARLVLSTGNKQLPAVALYENAGYRPVAAFGYYANHPGALFYGKQLQT